MNIPVNAEKLTLLLEKVTSLIASTPPTVGNAQNLAELVGYTADVRRQMMEELQKVIDRDTPPGSTGSPVPAPTDPKPQSPLAAEK